MGYIDSLLGGTGIEVHLVLIVSAKYSFDLRIDVSHFLTGIGHTRAIG